MSDSTTDAGAGGKHVADPEEFNQQRRLRSIHDARDRARELYAATQDPSIEAGAHALQANFRAAVQNYIGELEGLLSSYDYEEANIDNIWTGQNLGPVIVHPPQELSQLEARNDIRVIADSLPQPSEYEVPGLRGFLEAQFPIQETFEVPIWKRHQGQDTVEATVRQEMPVDVSYRAFRVANRFLTEVGIDIEVETSDHRSVVDEDVIEEVEEWRQKNLE